METGKYLIENGIIIIGIITIIIVAGFKSQTLTLWKGLLTTSRIISFHVSRKEEPHSEYDFLFFSYQQDKGSVAARRFEQLQSGVAVENSKPKELVCSQNRRISMRCQEQHWLT